MPSIFNNPNVMQMAGLQVMSGKPVGDALQNALVSDAQMQRQALETQELERQQRAQEALMASDAPEGVDPALWQADPYTALKLRMSSIESKPSAVREYEYFSSLSPEDQANYLLTKRAGQYLDLGEGFLNPITRESIAKGVSPDQQPALKGEQERAKQEAALDVEQKAASEKKELAADDVISLAQEAESYLDVASSGYLDAAGAIGKRALGRSDAETQANTSLEVIGGKLVAAMPRMEGPQSNYDVQLYREMAGRIADKTVPAEDRRAALKQLVRLNKKWANKASASPQEGVIDFNDLPE